MTRLNALVRLAYFQGLHLALLTQGVARFFWQRVEFFLNAVLNMQLGKGKKEV